MRATTTLLLFVSLLFSCSSVKRTQKFLASGNYNEAVELSAKKIQNDRSSKTTQAQIPLLEKAYAIAVEEDLRNMNAFKKENNVASVRTVYYLYLDLVDRQNLVRPLLPLYSDDLGRNANFKFNDYSSQLVTAKQNYVQSLYNEAQRYFSYNSVLDYRTSYNILCEIDELQPNYKDINKLKADARFYGTNFVLVSVNNQSGQIIPFQLEQELTNFNTYGLDEFWTVYHNQPENNTNYNYGIALNFRDILFTPDRITEREYERKATIKDGWEYRKDRSGNTVKDSLGNPIKFDKYKDVTAKILITQQNKEAALAGNVIYNEMTSNRQVNNFPIGTQFVFENVFANYRGDERALTNEDRNLLRNRFIPFPNNATMLLDAGEDIKARLKEIVVNNSI